MVTSNPITGNRGKVMIKVGIVGYGFAGRGIHSYLVQCTEGLKLSAVVSPSEEKRLHAEQQYGVKTYSKLEDLLTDTEIQLVIIATPHHLHAEQAILTMQAGKHCVVDKVMCMTSTEAVAMIETAKQNKVLLSVFQNRRWDWDFLTLKKALGTGKIGDPFRFESRVSRYRPPKQTWRTQRESMGGILFDWGSHLIDQALQLVQQPLKNIYCYISNRFWTIDIGTHCQLILTFANDIVFEIEISYLCSVERPRWTILGTEGAIIKYGLDPQEKAILSGDINKAVEDPNNQMKMIVMKNGEQIEQPFATVCGSWLEYYQNIVDVINGKAELMVKSEQVLKQIFILEAAMQSASTGKCIQNTMFWNNC